MSPRPVGLSLEELAHVLQVVAPLVPGTPGAIIRVAGIGLETAGQIVREITAAEIAEIRRQRAIGLASGAAANEASKKAGPPR